MNYISGYALFMCDKYKIKQQCTITAEDDVLHNTLNIRHVACVMQLQANISLSMPRYVKQLVKISTGEDW